MALLEQNPTPPLQARGPWRRRVLKWALWAVVIYAGWLLVACLFQRRLLFPRHLARAEDNPGAGIPGLVKHWLKTPEGKVEAWFVPGRGATKAKPGPAVIFAHGNAELIDRQHAVIHGYVRMGISVLLCEYRGYGRSAGSPSQAAITADHVRCYDWLVARADVDRGRIFYHGRSLGTGVVCALAARRPPRALILRSPFTSVADMMARYLIPRPLVRDPFDNEAVLKALDRPVLLLHGTGDRVVPYGHSVTLRKIAKAAVLSTYDCGHNDFPVGSQRFWADIESHLAKAGVLPGGRARSSH